MPLAMPRIPFFQALRKTFAGPRPWIEAIAVALTIFALFVFLPVWTTPGNDVAFQLHLISPMTYALMSALALLNGILIEMQWYLRRNRLSAGTGKQATTAFGIIATSFLSTIACASCYSSVLALLGLGGTAFVVTNRWWFAAIALSLTVFALAHTSRRVMGLCAACEIRPQKTSFRLW